VLFRSAFYRRAPVFLVGAGGLSAATKTAMTGAQHIWVLGSYRTVSDAVLDDLRATFPAATVLRLEGDDRYDTSKEIAHWAHDTYGMSFDYLGLTVGTNYPDALAAGALQGRDGRLLMLTQRDDLDHEVRLAIREHRADIPTGVRLFGGTNTLTSYVMGQAGLLLR
jgi:putative cell wall-binding protein